MMEKADRIICVRTATGDEAIKCEETAGEHMLVFETGSVRKS